jgi:transcription antitermination factor NusG
MQEVGLIPELFGTIELSENDKKWYVIHTKSRCEKKIAKWALQNAIEYYLPQYDSFRVYKNKKVHFSKILIPGYFFTKCTFKEKEIIVRAGHVANFLLVKNERELVDDLQRIFEGRQTKLPMSESVYLEKGYKVKITSGPLIGLEGIVESIDSPESIILNVNVLRKAVSVTLPICDFEIIKTIENLPIEDN